MEPAPTGWVPAAQPKHAQGTRYPEVSQQRTCSTAEPGALAGGGCKGGKRTGLGYLWREPCCPVPSPRAGELRQEQTSCTSPLHLHQLQPAVPRHDLPAKDQHCIHHPSSTSTSHGFRLLPSVSRGNDGPNF